MAYALSLTFTPSRDPPMECWSFCIDGSRQNGWLNGNLCSAVRAALTMSWDRGQHGLVVVLPRASWLGLRPVRFVIREPADVAALRSVDIDRLRARHRAAARQGLAMARARLPVLRAWGMLQMPAAWPAVP